MQNPSRSEGRGSEERGAAEGRGGAGLKSEVPRAEQRLASKLPMRPQ